VNTRSRLRWVYVHGLEFRSLQLPVASVRGYAWIDHDLVLIDRRRLKRARRRFLKHSSSEWIHPRVRRGAR
jgi:hypothetical protein